MNEKYDHDWHLGRTVMYPVLLGTSSSGAQTARAATLHTVDPPGHGRGGGGAKDTAGGSPDAEADASSTKDAGQHGASVPAAVAPTPPQTAPPAQRGLIPPRRRMTAVG